MSEGGEAFPLWVGIEANKKAVCGYGPKTGTYQFTIKQEYDENTRYVPQIFERIDK